MPTPNTQELQRAFMGGFAAWIIQVALVLTWVIFGSHKFLKNPIAPVPQVDSTKYSKAHTSSLALEFFNISR